MIIDTNENKFIELISNIPNVAVQGYDKERNVIYWNKASEHIYGYTKEEAFGKKLEDLIIPDFMKEAVVQGICNWYEKGEQIPSSELPLRHKDGSTVFVYSSHVMLAKDTDSPEMFCVDIDLTHQKEQEKSLKEQEALLVQQSKMAAMGEMVDAIAHQWKQPLSIMSSDIQNLEVQTLLNKSVDTELVCETREQVQTQIGHLVSTIDEFRSFFRPNQKRNKIILSSLIQSTLLLIKDELTSNQIKVEVLGDVDAEFACVENELKHVFINLINNSKDAFNKNSVLEERKIVFEILNNDNHLNIKVSDNAGGIPSEILDKVFTSNFTTKEEGTGIGLYMTQQIVNKYNGSIKAVASSKDINGAEFIISLVHR